jgi:ABC-type multidrug transport system fused ATPase/permease subunit
MNFGNKKEKPVETNRVQEEKEYKETLDGEIVSDKQYNYEHSQQKANKKRGWFNKNKDKKEFPKSSVDSETTWREINLFWPETIAIVGATGAGKSTIINLLSRFYDINSGEILIDGHNVTDYQLGSLRKEIAVVLQDVFLFADTISNNISLFKEGITTEDIENAAKEIGVHDFIATLPNAYAYNVKERGSMLSSGQRQLIAFFRAYVSQPSILILDEATSSIDTYSELLIQKATEKITEGRTSIIIAHRLATIKNADRIVVMDAGKIVEIGNHKGLLAKENGYYKNLYNAQFQKSAEILES